MADLIATCYGGRNHKCGRAFANRVLSAGGSTSKQSSEALWASIEEDLLNGQKLQGVDTAREVAHCLAATGHLDRPGMFPLFRRIHSIACEGGKVDTLFDW